MSDVKHLQPPNSLIESEDEIGVGSSDGEEQLASESANIPSVADDPPNENLRRSTRAPKRKKQFDDSEDDASSKKKMTKPEEKKKASKGRRPVTNAARMAILAAIDHSEPKVRITEYYNKK